MIAKYLILLFAFLLSLGFIYPNYIYANTYYFQDEFNQTRSPNILDPSKWTIYPNAATGVTTIQESSGNLQISQKTNTYQFPLIVSKNALPNGNYVANIQFQYTNVTYWGTGIALSEQAPTNGGGFNQVLTIELWQDKSYGPNMRIAFGNDMSQVSNIVYTLPINTNTHLLSVEYKVDKYLIYFDSNLVYISPPTNTKLKYIWLGNPSIQNVQIPDWSAFKVDFVRVSGLPTPFLDLPWDYGARGLSFNEAALAINSFFDHQYPLLSRGLDLGEPASSSANIIDYLGRTTNNAYTKHDGYDYGIPAKVKMGDPVLAAGAGSATYISSCTSCGNMIVIDHGNGYQTRYMHLLDDGLITNIPNQPVQVINRQQIGKVGFSGNSIPKNENGAHIHFGVFQDKDGDGDFSNNEPDGATDPFGWQSKSTDPWSSYAFNYLNQNRTGNKSYYLWKNSLAAATSTVTSNGANIKTGNFSINFPQNTNQQNMTVNTKSTPVVQPSKTQQSLGSTLFINAFDNPGNPINNLQNFYTINLDFSNLDTSKLKVNTFSFYTSPDGINWTKENTSFPSQTTASTQVNHFSYFALIGERKDATPPATLAEPQGTKGEGSWFRSDVRLTLKAQDNEEGSGVDYTLYKINDGDIKLYEEPIRFTKEGKYKVEFYSLDKDGNSEDIKSVEFNIDKTAPEAKIYLDEKLDLKVIALDKNETDIVEIKNRNNVIYEIEDMAGNNTRLDLREFDKNKKDKFKIYSLRYNDQNFIYFPKNYYIIKFENSENPIRLLQRFILDNIVKVRIAYDKKINKSRIYIIENGREELKETETGQVLLMLKTNKGKIEYIY